MSSDLGDWIIHGREEFRSTVIAQHILREIGKWLNQKREVANKRWIFELLQNAIDVARNNRKQSQIEIKLDTANNVLIFKHNSGPFLKENLINLIDGGSSKVLASQFAKNVGRFGSGFITTHVLNRIVQIQGAVLHPDSPSRFSFSLDRSSEDPAALAENMDKVLVNELRQNQMRMDPSDALICPTSFAYRLSGDSVKSAEIGISEVSKVVNFMLALNEEDLTITIGDDKYQKRELRLSEDIYEAHIKRNGIDENRSILYWRRNGVYVAILKEGNRIKSLNGIPRLFISVPLVASELIEIPFVIGSLDLKPEEERDQISLTASDSPASINNRSIIAEAFSGFEKLVDYCVLNSYDELHNICNFGSVKGALSSAEYSEEWQKLIRIWILSMANKKIIKLESDANRKAFPEVVFPVPLDDPNGTEPEILNSVEFIEFHSILKAQGKILPEAMEAYEWQKVLKNWLTVSQLPGVRLYGIKDLIQEIKDARKSNKGAGRYQPFDAIAHDLGITPDKFWSWLRRFYALADSLLSKGFSPSRLEDLIPTESGQLFPKNIDYPWMATVKPRLRIKNKESYHDNLQEIAEQLGYNVSQTLVRSDFSDLEIIKRLFQEVEQYNAERLLKDILLHRPAVDKKFLPSEEQVMDAWIKFFVWSCSNGKVLESTPMITEDKKVRYHSGSTSTILLPLSELDIATVYHDLFPKQFILHHRHFAEEILNAYGNTKDRMQLQNAMLSTSFVTDNLMHFSSQVTLQKSILKGMLKDYDGKTRIDPADHKVKCRGENRISSLWFLPDILRDVANSVGALKVIFFLVDEVCRKADSKWCEPIDVECLCSKGEHTIYPAQWLGLVCSEDWIPIEEGEGDKAPLSKDSVGKILGTSYHELLNRPRGEDLLRVLRFDRLELYLESAADTDTEKKALRNHLADIVRNVGGPTIEKFARLSAENPQVLEEHLEKLERDKFITNRNHIIGKAVEELIAEALRGLGKNTRVVYVGADIEVWPQEEEGNDVGWLEIGDELEPGHHLVEVKFTVSDRARISKAQRTKALEYPSNYHLLVVPADRKMREDIMTLSLQTEDVKDLIKESVINAASVVSTLASSFSSINTASDEIEVDITGYWIKKTLWTRVGRTFQQWASSI